MALTVSLAGTCLLIYMASRPLSPIIATTVSLLLGGNGIVFALSNWVPYALISCEASAQAQSRLLVMSDDNASADENDTLMLPGGGEGESDTSEFHDDIPLLLAVHNMAITMPQVMASVASWVLMQFLALFGLEKDVTWVFAFCIPPALWAACL